MSNLKGYIQIARTAIREDRANPIRLVAQILLGVLRLWLIAVIYKVAYETVTGSAISYENAVWCIGSYFVLIVGLGLRKVFLLADQEVRTGAVEVGLIKPLDWRLVKVSRLVGLNIVEAVALTLAFTLTLLLVVGPPDLSYVTWQFSIGYIVLVALALVTSATLYMTVGLSAFWLNDAKSVYRIVDKAVLIFAGAWVPAALLPTFIQEVVRYSPFGVISASTQFFNPALEAHLTPTLIAAIAWTAVLLLGCQWVWKRAERRIEVNGG